MAFSKFNFVSATDLKNTIESFFTTAGYTKYGTNTYKRGNSFYHQLSVITDAISDEMIKFTIGDGIDGGNNPTQTFTQDPPAFREVSTGTCWAFDDGTMTYFVIKYTTGKYQHMAIGEINKYETATDGALTIGSRSSYNLTINNAQDNLYLCARYNTSGSVSDIRSVGGMKYNGVYYDQNMGNSSLQIGPAVVCFCLGNMLASYQDEGNLQLNPFNEKIKSAARSDNGLPVLQAIYTSASTTANTAFIVGELSSIRHTNVKDLEPGAVLNYGNDEWYFFPTFDATQEDYGFAYKKVS